MVKTAILIMAAGVALFIGTTFVNIPGIQCFKRSFNIFSSFIII